MLIPGGGAMKSVRIERVKLLEKVRENREKHVTEYNEAVQDYIDLVQEVLASNLKTVKKNIKIAKDMNSVKADFDSQRPLPRSPMTYENEYNRAISMLEMSNDDVIEIESEVFNQLVLDEWDWKNNFVVSNMAYKTALGSM